MSGDVYSSNDVISNQTLYDKCAVFFILERTDEQGFTLTAYDFYYKKIIVLLNDNVYFFSILL